MIITRLNGETICQVRVNLKYTVRRLKQQIKGFTHVPVVEQQLSCSGTILWDEDLLLNLLVPDVPLVVMLSVRPWTDEEIKATREELERSVWNVDAVEAILARMPFYDDDQASVLGHPLTIAVAAGRGRSMESWPWKLQRVVAMIMDKVKGLAPELQERILLPAVQKVGEALQHVSDEMQNNEAIVMTAVQQNGLALQHASEEMKNNVTIGMAAVQQNWRALEYASVEMKKNEKIVRLARVLQDGSTLQYASAELKNDETTVMAAVQQSWRALQYASEEMKNNNAIVLAAVRQDGRAIQYAAKEMKNNEAIVMAAVKDVGSVLRFASDEMKNNEEIVIVAVSNPNPTYSKKDLFRMASKALQKNQGFRKKVGAKLEW